MTGFTALDAVVLALYAVAVLGTAFVVGRTAKTTRAYFLANRDVRWWVAAGSIVATETSTLTVVSLPGMAWGGNMTFLQLAFGYLLGRTLVAFLLVPAYFRGEYETSYQLLRENAGRRTRLFSSSLFLVTRTLADGVRLYLTGIVLAVVAPGLGEGGAIAVMGAVTVLFTAIGGLRAVLWTDVIQLGIYLAGGVVGVVVVSSRLDGGLASGLAEATEAGKFRIFDFGLDPAVPYSFWAAVSGGTLLTMATHGTDHLLVQRLLCCRAPGDAKRALVASALAVMVQFALFLGLGALLFVYFRQDPPSAPFGKTDEVFPFFVVHHLPPGVTGLLVAAIFAAAVSTLSSSLNSLASVTVSDFYRPLVRPGRDEAHYLRFSRGLTVLWGAALVAAGYGSRGSTAAVELALTIANFTAGAVLGVFLLAVLRRRRLGDTAGLAGMAASVGLVLYLYYGLDVGWTWLPLAGTPTCVVVALLVGRIARVSVA